MYLKQIGLRATREDLWKKMRRPIFESSRSWGADIAIRSSNYFLSILDLRDWRRRCRCTAAMSGIENADAMRMGSHDLGPKINWPLSPRLSA